MVSCTMGKALIVAFGQGCDRTCLAHGKHNEPYLIYRATRRAGGEAHSYRVAEARSSGCLISWYLFASITASLFYQATFATCYSGAVHCLASVSLLFLSLLFNSMRRSLVLQYLRSNQYARVSSVGVSEQVVMVRRKISLYQ